MVGGVTLAGPGVALSGAGVLNWAWHGAPEEVRSGSHEKSSCSATRAVAGAAATGVARSMAGLAATGLTQLAGTGLTAAAAAADGAVGRGSTRRRTAGEERRQGEAAAAAAAAETGEKCGEAEPAVVGGRPLGDVPSGDDAAVQVAGVAGVEQVVTNEALVGLAVGCPSVALRCAPMLAWAARGVLSTDGSAASGSGRSAVGGVGSM
jgi:hypothetical protein